MPVHDWRRVDPGVFHDFHNVWIGLLRNALNEGGLPSGYYAMSEQHIGKYVSDVLTLHKPIAPPGHISGALAVAEAPPKVRRKLSLAPDARARRKTLAIRHVSDHRLIAVVEIVSPANKDRHDHVREFLDKIEDLLAHGIHILLVDLFPPGSHDPLGLHAALWDRLGDTPEPPPADEPLTLASYVAGAPVEAYLEHLAVGQSLADMPLFLDPGIYVYTPLEETYQATWRGTPEPWRAVLQA
ncbi:MAG: DUF4058 family protein [Gemmataceae bacterium]